jgi:glycosyltransferase involved in cell wall biosynthesis
MIKSLDIKVSVIVPVYNVEEYVKKCIDSLLNQTLKEIEIIVVNDGSADASLSVIEGIAVNNPDRKIEIITQSNKGLGAARNTGAANATGEYIAFIDGDDWVEPQMMETMYNEAMRADADVCICDFNKRYADREELMHGGNIPAELTVDSKEVLRLFLIGKILIGATNKIFRRSFYEKNAFQFPVGYLYEDLPVVILVSKANKIVKVEGAFYNYRQRSGSIMKTLTRSMLGKWDLVQQIKQYLINENYLETLQKEFQWFYSDVIVLQLVHGCIMNGDSNPSLRDEMISEILAKPDTRIYLQRVWSNPYFSIRQKVALILLKCNPGIYRILYRRFFVKN